jgi:hypothetical protein
MRLFKKLALTVPLLALFLFPLIGSPAHAASDANAHTIGAGTSYAGPSVQYACNGQQYFAYTDIDNHINIWSFTTGDIAVTSQTTPFAPALSCWKNQLVVAWRSESGNDIFTGIFNGNDIPTIHEWPKAATDEPLTLTSDGSTLYLGWVGLDNPKHLNLMELQDPGTVHSPIITFTDYTHPVNPLTFTFGGVTFYYDSGDNTLCVTWSAADASYRILVGFFNGTTQLSDVSLSDSSRDAPGMYAEDGIVDLIWVGNTNTHLYTGNLNGNGWSGNHQQSDTSFYAPSIDGDGSIGGGGTNLATAFTGTNNIVYFDRPSPYQGLT